MERLAHVLAQKDAWAEAGVQSLAEKFKLDERAAYKLSEVQWAVGKGSTLESINKLGYRLQRATWFL